MDGWTVLIKEMGIYRSIIVSKLAVFMTLSSSREDEDRVEFL